jgi:hypothetical protein
MPMHDSPVKAKCKARTAVALSAGRFFLFGLAFIATGCASNTIEDAVPQAALAKPEVSEVQQAAGAPVENPDQQMATGEQFPGPEDQLSAATAESGAEGYAAVAPVPIPRPVKDGAKTASAARNPVNGADGYPDLNVVPGSGQTQISAQEKAAALSELQQAQLSQKVEAGTASDEEILLLRRLAQTNGDEVLREIEGK